jgi:hypothetical protein
MAWDSYKFILAGGVLRFTRMSPSPRNLLYMWIYFCPLSLVAFSTSEAKVSAIYFGENKRNHQKSYGMVGHLGWTRFSSANTMPRASSKPVQTRYLEGRLLGYRHMSFEIGA